MQGTPSKGRLLKVDLGIMCRGIGTCYVELLVSDISEHHTIAIEAQTLEGYRIPLQQHQQNTQEDERCRIVCLLPYWRGIEFDLICTEFGADGEVCAEVAKRLSFVQIKWASRYNYRLKAMRTNEVRALCDRLDYRYVYLYPLYYLLNNQARDHEGSEHILKAVIHTRYADEIVHVSLLDGNGYKVQEQTIASQAFHPYFPEQFWGECVYEAPFSFRIPDDGKTYCIVAKLESKGSIGFLNIDDEARDYLSAVCNWSFYKVDQKDYYERALRSGKLGAQDVSLVAKTKIDVGLFSIIVPLYHTPLQFLKEMVDSVLQQAYSNWELILVNASPDDAELVSALAALDDERIRVIEISENKGIAENTNVGVLAANGDYVFLLDHDDFIEPLALYEYAQALVEDPSIDVLYCDEDYFNEERGFVNPHFKSDFNIDLLHCHNYITHFLGMRASLIKELLLDSTYDAAQDYDLLLRAVEQTRAIKHIPHVLYHWRMHNLSTSMNHDTKVEAAENGRRALQAHLDRCGIMARTELTEYPYIYRPIYEVEGAPKVSILIPSKDNADVLRRCIDSIEQKSTYKNYEIIVIENNSTASETFEMYEKLQQDYSRVKVITWEHEFNYSAINNYGVQFVEGDYLLLLNNDTEVISPDWIEGLLSICQRSDVGIVGAKLLFPDDTVQHAGVIMMCSDGSSIGGPAHIFASLDSQDPGYYYRAVLKQDLSAVTGACLMTKRSLFQELGGLSEDFAVAYNDVDYCLRVREKGLLVVFNPDVQLYHYESLTRGLDTPTSGSANFERFLSEQSLLRARWPRYYVKGDPYHGKFATLFLLD